MFPEKPLDEILSSWNRKAYCVEFMVVLLQLNSPQNRHCKNVIKYGLKKKKAIAKATLKLLNSGQTIFIDAGSTTTFLAEEFRLLSGVTVITNSLNVAEILSSTDSGVINKARNQVILLGGNMDSSSRATYGEKTIDEIYRYQADVAILSPVGIDARHGASSFNQHENFIARAMVHQSNQFIALADHSKIGMISRIVYAPVNEISILVTDRHSRNMTEFALLEQAISNVIIS